MDGYTYTKWFEEFEYGRTYIVSEIVQPSCPFFSDKLMTKIEIGDKVSFHEPKNEFCKIVRNGFLIAHCPETFLPDLFCVEGSPPLYPEYKMYRLSKLEDAEAIFSGVPIEDVYA